MTANFSIPLENLSKRYSRYYMYVEPVVSDPLIRGYFSLIASLFAIAFFVVFALSPTTNTILGLQKKIAEERKIVTDLDKKINDLREAQQNYAQIENSLAVLSTALPESPMPQSIVSAVANAASVSGLTIQSLQFRDIPLSPDSIATSLRQSGGKSLPTVPLTIVVSGNFQTIQEFLRRIENDSRIITLDNIIVSKTADKTHDLVTIKALGYYFAKEDR